MDTFADRILDFNSTLHFGGQLPEGIRIMNPYQESEFAVAASTAFYRKYYNDNHKRHLILGINPGRFGSGLTGVAFTDPKRMISKCDIPFAGPMAHEPSSEFIYEMIDAFGGSTAFYSRLFINSICPLGFTAIGKNGKEVNCNYYDYPALQKAMYPFIIENIKKQINMGFETDVCFCFGTGKNEAFFRKLNAEQKFFKEIVALEHPRFIMQYKFKTRDAYIQKYLEAFSRVS